MYEPPPPMVCPTLSGPMPGSQVGHLCHRCGRVGHFERYCPALSGPFPGDQVGPGPLSLIRPDGRGHQCRYRSAKSVAAPGTSSVLAPPYWDLFPGPGLDQGPPSRTSLNQQHRPISSNSRRIAHSPSRRPAGEEREEATATAQNSQLPPPCSYNRHPPGPGQSTSRLRDRHTKDSQSAPYAKGRR